MAGATAAFREQAAFRGPRRPFVTTAAYRDLRRPARRRPAPTAIAARICTKLLTDLGADVVFATPIDGDPLFTYLRTSQRHAARSRALAAAADIVIVNEPASRGIRTPTRSIRCRSPRSVTAVPTTALDLPEEVLQARSGSLSATAT